MLRKQNLRKKIKYILKWFPPELLVFTCSEFLGSFSTDGKVMFVTSSPFLKSPPDPQSHRLSLVHIKMVRL